jgi:hypothetical protein
MRLLRGQTPRPLPSPEKSAAAIGRKGLGRAVTER